MAHQPTALKILAIGAPLSALSVLQAKITSFNAKAGPFDACVVVGDLFEEGSDGSELDGIALPVPTYFTIGQNSLPEKVKERIAAGHGEVADNLVFLGRSSVLTTAQGLKIGCIGGKYDADNYVSEDEDPFFPHLTKKSASSLLAHPLLSPEVKLESLADARTTPLPSAFQGLDLLLLPNAPPGISLLSSSFASSGVSIGQSALELAELVRKARPRYTLWSDGEGFWEREPFGWGSPEERWTRGVKLGQLGAQGEKKARWHYAFTLPAQTPSTALPSRPANTTPNPFALPPKPIKEESNIVIGKKRAAETEETEVKPDDDRVKRERTDHGPPPDNYICKICHVPGHWLPDCPKKAAGGHPTPPEGYKCNICQSTEHFIRECPNKEAVDRARNGPRPPPRGYTCRACGAGDHFLKDCPAVKERNKKKELGPAECWFCLSNPRVTKHLICSIGSETYVTLPKGQLPTTDGPVPGGGHVLIIPIAHHPTLLSIPAEDAIPIISEIESTKSALTRCYAEYGAVPVMWEVGRLSGRGGHAHVQVVPVPTDVGPQVEEAFRKAGASQGIDWEDDPEKALGRAGKAGNYFKVELPGGGKLVHLLKGGFDLQLGRMVLAGLLGLHHRVDWKECGKSEEEEREDAVKFKKAFTPFVKQ